MTRRPTLVDPFRSKARAASRTLGCWVTSDDLRTMWQRQDGRCGLTGQPMDLASATLDHIVPKSRGGTNNLINIRWTTKAANRAKGDLLDEEFVELCRLVVAHLGGGA